MCNTNKAGTQAIINIVIIVGDSYYENDNKINTLKKIAHLIEYTNLVLCIQGAKGVGKTCLLKQRILTAKPDWEICYLSAKDYTSTDAFVEKIASDLHINLNSNNDATDNMPSLSLQENLDSLVNQGKQPILIIDDIEQLKENLLAMLASFISPLENNRPRMRLLIAGEDIPQMLLNIIPKENNEACLKFLPILPLSEIETGDYIKFKLVAAGFEKTSPFTTKAINKIYLDAKGFPNIINQLANHYLSEYAQGKIAKPSILNMSDNNSGLKIAVAGLSVLVIGVIINILMSNGDEADLQQVENLQIPITSIPPKTSLTSTVFNQQKSEETTKEETIELSPPPVISAESINKKIEPKTLISKQITPVKTSNEKQKIKPDETSKPTNNTSQNNAPNSLSSREWVAQQNPKHYTLQLIGGSQKKSVEHFVKKHKIEKDAHIISTIRKGKPWFSVIYKSYSQHKKATAAADSLPSSLKKVKPWIRTFAHIKRDMK